MPEYMTERMSEYNVRTEFGIYATIYAQKNRTHAKLDAREVHAKRYVRIHTWQIMSDFTAGQMSKQMSEHKPLS